MKFTKIDPLNIEVFDTRLEMGVSAGKAVEEKILQLLNVKDEIRMIFAAAPSQIELLTYLRHSTRIPWHRITAFHMDEYIGLSSETPQLFSNFLKKHLFDHVNFKAVHLINGNADIEAECRRYTSLVRADTIDIVCLGIGENGHIAFNDPPVADFEDPEILKEVELDEECRHQQVNDGCFSSIGLVPETALTLTVPTLMQGDFLYCVVPGKSKRNAVTETLYGPVSTDCPSTILKTHPSCILYLDRESYSERKNILKTIPVNP